MTKKVELIGDWVDETTAKTWKEGSIVLIRREDREITSYNALELISYFRPDWVGKQIGYGAGKHIKYLLLNKNE